MTTPPLSKMPISAPLWVWLLYAAMVIGFCLLSGGFWPLLTAMFSFQFWTFAVWRGLKRQESNA